MSSNIIYQILCSCILCKSIITTANLSKHYNSNPCKTGNKSTKYIRLTNCKYCSIDISSLPNGVSANHIRWCDLNPRSNSDKIKLGIASSNLTKTPESIQKQIDGIKLARANGAYVGSAKKSVETRRKNNTLNHSDESKEKCRVAALKSPHQRVCKKSHEYIDKRGRKFILDSSWEDALADRLDELNLNWDRPSSINYQLNGYTKRYFADFYLPDFDLYLDPKNEYAKRQQKEKLDIVSKLINLLILNSLEECKNFNIS